MAISKIFGGTTIFVPGAYDTKNVILTGAAPSVAVGKVAIIGESSKGPSGIIMQFSPDALSDLVSIYGEGEIVQAAKALAAPSNDARISQGASSIYVYKTNPSTKASLTLATAFGSVSAISEGTDGNLISLSITKAAGLSATASSSSAFIEINIASGDKFILRELGGAANTFTFAASPANKAALIAALALAGNWSAGLPTSTSISVGGIDGAVTISLSSTADALDHRLGFGRTFELAAGSPDALVKMNISAGVKSSQTEPAVRVLATLTSKGIVEDSDETIGNVGGKIALKIGYAGTTASVDITSTSLVATVVGGTGVSLTVSLGAFSTLQALAEFINSKAGYTCSVPSGFNGGFRPSILDRVLGMKIASSAASATPGLIKADSSTFASYIANYSVLLDVTESSKVGLPDDISSQFLSGAVLGATATSDVVAGLTAFEAVDDVDLVVPLFSQDASDDLAENSGSTDLASSYDIESILVATRTHCKKMSSTKNRKERQAYVGYRGTFAECTAESLSLSSEFLSILIEDVLVANLVGDLEWARPHMAAALSAGMHAGGNIGQPTTKKYIAAQGKRHVKKQGLTPSVAEAFNARTKADQAIQAGIMPLEAPGTGGVRIVVQNTTYSKDNNFVFNRPSVISSMNFIAKSMRSALEAKFIGEKSRTATKNQIKAEVEGLMSDFLRSDIIVGDSTNGGLGYKNLVVSVVGNTVLIDITVTPVQGIDFIFTNINIDNIRVSA